MPAVLDLRNIPDSARKKLPKSDFAGPGMSYPIAKPEDVAAAAKLVGKADDPPAVKAKIIRIAKRKGASFVAQLPKAWTEKQTSASIQLPGRAIILADDDPGEGAATTWVQVLRVGKFWSARYKDFSVTKSTLSKMVQNFRTITPKAPTELPLDYNHGTNRPDTIEQGKAAGWIKDIELRGDNSELWAQVELTPEAADLVRNKEYRYISATFEFDHIHTDGDKRQTSIGPTLFSAALTNTPFVEGMQPVTLGKQAAIALTEDDEATEDDFSYEEQRRRVQAALTEAFGNSDDGSYYGGCQLVDLFDGRAVYRENGTNAFEVSYTIDSAGTVHFTDDPAEVVSGWKRLATPTGETEMSKTIKIKDAAGNEIELSEETVLALAKAHAPKPAADGLDLARLDEIELRLTKADADIVELSAKNLALETERKETAAKAKVDALIRAGKIAPKQRAEWTKLALADRATFQTLTDGLPVTLAYDEQRGSSEDLEARSAVDETLALTAAEMEKDPKLTRADATSRVFSKNPDLYRRYTSEAAVRV